MSTGDFDSLKQTVRASQSSVPAFDSTRDTHIEALEAGLEIGPDDDRYRLEERLGSGAFGHVWRATALSAVQTRSTHRALKVINPLIRNSPHEYRNLKVEAERAAGLKHPHIVNVYGWRQGKDGLPFVVMEYLDGVTLRDVILHQGAQSLERIEPWLKQIASALDYAHQERLIHRDIKPENLILTERNGKDVVNVVDFGLACSLQRSSTLSQIASAAGTDPKIAGTAPYLSPQALKGAKPDAKQDLYALGCVVYELLTGQVPFIDAALYERTPSFFPVPPAQLEPAAWVVLQNMLAYDPEDRPKTATDFVEALWEAKTRKEAERLREIERAEAVRRKAEDAERRRQAQEVEEAKRKRQAQEAEEAKRKRQVEEAKRKARQEATEKTKQVLMAVLVVFVCGGLWYWSSKDSNSAYLPDMVRIEGGCFQMGSPEGEAGRDPDEKRHRVCVDTFEMGKYEVTFAEYDRFCEATGREKPDDEGWWFLDWGRGKRPVTNVSWHDAVAYTQWLSKETGKDYRLPTEAEWEYAARAGTTTAFWWGNRITPEQANYDGNAGKTLPVGSFDPNPWGLYDTAGNVWEWTCSKYDEEYGGDEKVCISNNQANTPSSLRGGSWYLYPRWVRSAFRYWDTPDNRLSDLGFRLSRYL